MPDAPLIPAPQPPIRRQSGAAMVTGIDSFCGWAFFGLNNLRKDPTKGTAADLWRAHHADPEEDQEL